MYPPYTWTSEIAQGHLVGFLCIKFQKMKDEVQNLMWLCLDLRSDRSKELTVALELRLVILSSSFVIKNLMHKNIASITLSYFTATYVGRVHLFQGVSWW